MNDRRRLSVVKAKLDEAEQSIRDDGLSHGGGGGYDGDMDTTAFATKADLAELRGEVRSGFAELRTDFAEGKIDIQRWMLGTVIGLFVGFGGLFLAMSNALKPPAAPTAQQPIIINVPAPAPAAPTK